MPKERKPIPTYLRRLFSIIFIVALIAIVGLGFLQMSASREQYTKYGSQLEFQPQNTANAVSSAIAEVQATTTAEIRSYRLANEALFQLPTNANLALPFIFESVALEDPPIDSVRAFYNIGLQSRNRQTLLGHRGNVNEVTYSPRWNIACFSEW